MRIYYAHCQSLYGTPQEKRDIHMLMQMGFSVISPSAPEHANRARRLKEHHGSEAVMEYFTLLVKQDADALAFRALPDGSIGAGVAKEIVTAVRFDKPVFELPSCIKRRTLSVEQTREYLHEVGQR